MGRVHIQSGLDAYAPLDFEPGYLDEYASSNCDFTHFVTSHPPRPADLSVLRWAYKKGREFARRMDSFRGEFELGHPDYPQGSGAATNGLAQPVDISSPDIIYSAEDDKAIDEYHRKSG